MKMDNSGQLNKETHRARSGRAPNTELPCSRSMDSALPAGHTDGFTNQTAPLSLGSRDFTGLYYILGDRIEIHL